MSKQKQEVNEGHIAPIAVGHEVVSEAHETAHSDKEHGKAHGHGGAHAAHGGGHGHSGPRPEHGIYNSQVAKKVKQKKFHLPVIGHFANKSVEFPSIFDAWRATGIHYSLIFEACIGKIFKAKNVIWEFKKGNHYIKYKAFYINASTNYKRKVGFNG